jgi:hypothetical protein
MPLLLNELSEGGGLASGQSPCRGAARGLRVLLDWSDSGLGYSSECPSLRLLPRRPSCCKRVVGVSTVSRRAGLQGAGLLRTALAAAAYAGSGIAVDEMAVASDVQWEPPVFLGGSEPLQHAAILGLALVVVGT